MLQNYLAETLMLTDFNDMWLLFTRIPKLPLSPQIFVIVTNSAVGYAFSAYLTAARISLNLWCCGLLAMWAVKWISKRDIVSKRDIESVFLLSVREIFQAGQVCAVDATAHPCFIPSAYPYPSPIPKSLTMKRQRRSQMLSEYTCAFVLDVVFSFWEIL